MKSAVSLGLAALLCLAAGTGPAFALDEPWYKKALRKITRRAPPPESPPAAAPKPQPVSAVFAPEAETVLPPEKPAQKAAAPARRPTPPAPRSFLHTPTREYKKTPRSRTLDDSGAEFETLTSDGYDGPDLSKERTPQEENMIRKFPLPAARIPEAPRVPPAPDRYAPPQRPAEDTTSSGQ